jgi:DNA-binding beta-propeller fold protein YncE
MTRSMMVGLVVLTACRGQGREDREPHGGDVSSVPERSELGTLPYLGVTPMAMELGGGKLAGPETIIHDLDQDLYFVSNIRGSANEQDDDGYISVVSPAGEMIDQYFVDGRSPSVELHAPRGMALAGDTLYVADEGGVRLFDRKSGDPKGSWPVAGSQFLNSIAIDADGRVLVTDTGIELLPTGPVKTGPYTVYAFSADGKPTVFAQGDQLQGPNGIVAGPAGIFVVEFMGDEHGVYKLDRQGGKQLIGTLPFGQLDGLAMVPDGSLLVTSWLANGVYRLVPGEPPTLVVEHLTTPAGIAYDAVRSRILIPEVLGNTLHIEPWAPPSAKLQPIEDRQVR